MESAPYNGVVCGKRAIGNRPYDGIKRHHKEWKNHTRSNRADMESAPTDMEQNNTGEWEC